MAHLVKPIYGSHSQPIPIADVLSKLQAAHTYFVEHSMEAITAHATEDVAYWGTHIKRLRVQFPEDGDKRPELIDPSLRTHSLTEIYNQCATMERLMDGLRWAQTALPSYSVLRCHPTTSSLQDNQPEIPDHDLVLINGEKELARFEVSDVTNSEVDSNRKELKDLTSLGVLSPDAAQSPSGWPAGRVFLIVSAEFAVLLREALLSTSGTIPTKSILLELAHPSLKFCRLSYRETSRTQ